LRLISYWFWNRGRLHCSKYFEPSLAQSLVTYLI
jgi:hypothetical protein